MQKNDCWFAAKKYGWGWGLPTRWQGWLVYGVALSLIVTMFALFPPTVAPVHFMISSGGIMLILIATCWIKGERPSWRWGKK